jgi:hypothetical protein
VAGRRPRRSRPAKSASASSPITSCIAAGFAERVPSGCLPLLQ